MFTTALNRCGSSLLTATIAALLTVGGGAMAAVPQTAFVMPLAPQLEAAASDVILLAAKQTKEEKEAEKEQKKADKLAKKCEKHPNYKKCPVSGA